MLVGRPGRWGPPRPARRRTRALTPSPGRGVSSPPRNVQLRWAGRRGGAGAPRPWPLGGPLRRQGTAAAVSKAEDVKAAAAVARAGLQVPDDQGLTPKSVVELLDKYIVGQRDAKKAVAIALRNRWRRQRLESPLREEVVPKNILMIGPTGCGKTEIARRLAKLADAPFVKVEATKFTEVGFHGRDVDEIIRDLVDASIVLTKSKLRSQAKAQVADSVEKQLLDVLTGTGADSSTRETFRKLLRSGDLDERNIEVDVPVSGMPGAGQRVDGGPGNQMSLQEVVLKVDKLFNRRGTERRKMKVAEARPLLEEVEMEKVLNSDMVMKDALKAAEQDGIVFIDEIDKIVTNPDGHRGADASSEGVQQDLLPIIEGSTVSTKHGNVNTDHILFIASGAFHNCKPSDMLAELQGRLPIRVELKGLTKNDLYRILTEPEHNMVKQQIALMSTEGVQLVFTDDAIREITSVAAEVNRSVDNIGARRLHTILERVLEQISFEAPEKARASSLGGEECIYVVDKDDIQNRVGDLLEKMDLSKFIL